MLGTLSRIVFGSNFAEINTRDFSKKKFNEIVQFSCAFEALKLGWGVSQSLNDKGLLIRVLNGGFLGATSRINSLCLRFRNDEVTDCPTVRKIGSFALDQFRNACLAATSLITWENSFGDHAVHIVEEGIKNGLDMEGDVGKYVPAALICAVGLLSANGLDRIPSGVFLSGLPNLTRVIRICSIAHAVYGIYPELFKPVVEGFLETMSFNPTTNPILFTSIAMASISYMDARERPQRFRDEIYL